MSRVPSTLPKRFTYAQALAAGLTKTAIYQARDSGELELLARGIYQRAAAATEPIDLDLVELALRAPHATLCLETALAKHGLSDALITARDLAIPRGTRAPSMTAPVRWHLFQAETFALEKTRFVLSKDIEIGLYSAERTIVDCFRLRGREGHDVAYEALRRWLRGRNAQPSKLLAIAQKLPRATGPLQHALEVLG